MVNITCQNIQSPYPEIKLSHSQAAFSLLCLAINFDYFQWKYFSIGLCVSSEIDVYQHLPIKIESFQAYQYIRDLLEGSHCHFPV